MRSPTRRASGCGIGWGETTPRRPRHLGAGVLPRAVRLRAGGDARRPGDRRARPGASRGADRPGAAAMTRPRIFVPRDAGALALGADEVERAIIAAERRRGLDVEIVRTGSRGLFWLEPMIEVATAAGRIAYGPVRPEDVEALFDAGWLDGGAAPAAARPAGGHPVPQAADPFHLCALRHRRPAVARRLPRAWRVSRPRTGAGARARRRSSTRSTKSGLARSRRRRFPDRHQMAHHAPTRRRRRNTSSATPTRATAAPLPTA